MPLISLTTDFGLSDWYVGAMKGVIQSIAPDIGLIDLTHGIRPGDIRQGAFVLGATCRYFPVGTIHLVVVDPGVGSDRGALVLESGGHRYVAPDNGVLSMVAPPGAPFTAYRIENDRLALHPISRTFHGRDIFAPAAAHLATGLPLDAFGPSLEKIIRLPAGEPTQTDLGVTGEIAYIDRFGNAITNLPSTLLDERADRCSGIQLPDGAIGKIEPFYASVAEGQLIGIAGSTGMIEIAIRNASAEETHHLAPGQPVRLVLHPIP